MKYCVYLILTYAVVISCRANNKVESKRRVNNVDTSIVNQSKPYLLSKEDSLKLVKKFPVEIYYKVVTSTKDSMNILDFAIDTSYVFKWELNGAQKEKFIAADNITTDEMILISKAGAHLLSAITKDSSWFTNENIKKMMSDTAIINNMARKIGGPPLNIKLPSLKQ